MSTRNAIFSSLLLALLVGFFLVGAMINRLPEGLNESGWPAGQAIFSLLSGSLPAVHGSVVGVVWLVVVLLAIGVVAFLLVKRARVAAVDPGRRGFLTGAASGAGVAVGSMLVAGGAAGVRAFFGLGQSGPGWKSVSDHISGPGVPMTHEEWKETWKGARIQDYRRFGRTEWQVSDIVLGTGPLKGDLGTEIARSALQRGVNYIDTSPDYSAEGSEQAVGAAIRGHARDQLFLATKFCTPSGHLPPGTPAADYKAALEASLRRLGTDYVDLAHIHSCDTVERLMDPGVHEAFDQLKQEGKVRFLGVSTHTPNLVEVANAAVDSGRFDVMMLAYHHGIWAPLAGIVQRARSEQDMGIVAMKTLKGAKHHGLAGFREEADAYSQAALRWVLSNSDVSCAVISFRELQHLDEYLYASGGGEPAARELAVLEKYDREILGSYCAPHCGACLGACTASLPIHDILRYRMYFEDYGQEKEGMRLYGQLAPDANASQCSGCSAPCLGTCPTGIAIPERMAEAHELLTLT